MFIRTSGQGEKEISGSGKIFFPISNFSPFHFYWLCTKLKSFQLFSLQRLLTFSNRKIPWGKWKCWIYNQLAIDWGSQFYVLSKRQVRKAHVAKVIVSHESSYPGQEHAIFQSQVQHSSVWASKIWPAFWDIWKVKFFLNGFPRYSLNITDVKFWKNQKTVLSSISSTFISHLYIEWIKASTRRPLPPKTICFCISLDFALNLSFSYQISGGKGNHKNNFRF